MSSTQTTHDPALSHVANTTTSTSNTSGPAPTAQGVPTDVHQGLPLNLPQEQVIALLKQLPGVFTRIAQGDLKDSVAAEALSNLSQQSSFQLSHGLPMHTPFQMTHSQHLALNEPGPSSHPRGPPNLGQLSAAASAMQNGSQSAGANGTEGVPNLEGQAPQPDMEGPLSDGDGEKPSKGSGGRRSGRSSTMSNDEWTRQRKDNHKEVERRRRGNINEGINELGRIVPNGSGEKAKGAILSRAVQYIHHLKENEARNIEKWTLEKLLMDQAMGDLQAQLEEMRRLWEEERNAKQRLEAELEVLRGIHGGRPVVSAPAAAPAATSNPPPTSSGAPNSVSVPHPVGAAESTPRPPDSTGKRPREEEEMEDGSANREQAQVDDADERAKRQRVE